MNTGKPMSGKDPVKFKKVKHRCLKSVELTVVPVWP